MSERHIVAMGGGGFSMGRDYHALDDYIISLTGVSCPRICFLPTASGDAADYIVEFYDAFPAGKYQPSHLALFSRRVEDVEAFLLDQDVIYVGGGNTADMLAVWRVHGVDGVLQKAWERGTILCGLSAGSLCWFEGGTTDSFGPTLAPLRDGLAFLPGSHSPHYDGEIQRRPAYHRFILEGRLSPGIAADNGVGLHYVGTDLVDVVTSHEGRKAYRVGLVESLTGEPAIEETPIDPRLLSDL